METSKRDQCDPPSATVTERASFMGRKTCVVFVKSGSASLRVKGLGVCISMNAIEGRSRTMWEFVYFERCSRSRYLRLVVSGVVGCERGKKSTLPRMRLSMK